MDKQTVIITIQSQKISFWTGMAKILAADYRVVIPTRPDVRAVIKRLAPELVPCTVDVASLEAEVGAKRFDTVAEARRLEELYRVRLAMLLSERRDLGKGYLFNADLHPAMESAWWGHEDKLRKVVETFFYHDLVLDRYGPVRCWLGENGSAIPYLVCGLRGVLYASLGKIKYGGKFCWNDGPQYQCRDLMLRLAAYVRDGVDQGAEEAIFVQERLSAYRDSFARMGYGDALRRIASIVVSQTRHKIKRALLAAIGRPLVNMFGYRYLGWVPSVWRRPGMFRYFMRHGVRPSDLKQRRLVFFPLHMEPEVALMTVSPEFTNSLELVTWVSKSLPADTLLVVKENMHSFGVRSRRYYENFRMIGNVVLAHPEIGSWEWIKASNLVTTITGTAAVEAVYFGKPVLSFGKHQPVNLLPTVRYASNYETTLGAVHDLLDMDPGDPAFTLARNALYKAQMEASFEFPDVPALLDHDRLCMANSEAALQNLQGQFPALRRLSAEVDL